MRDLVRAEFERMTDILRRNGFHLTFDQPVLAHELSDAEAATGIRFDEGLRALYSLASGSLRRTCLAVLTDELTPCCLVSLQDTVAWWREWLPYDDRIHMQFWGDNGPRGEVGRDPRIQPDCFVNRSWLPIAEFNGWSTAVYFDAAPTTKGSYGQIIAYQHDPDAVYFLAENIVGFLRISNDRLETHAKDLLFCDGRPSSFSPPPIQQ